MIKKKNKNETSILSSQIIDGIQEKKGHKIVTLDLSKIENSVCKMFVMCHATSKTQVAAIADSVYDLVKKNTEQIPWHKEGYQNADWILLDYVDVVVHIFTEETRKFYNLEGLWADAEKKEIKD
jgi:ribosome-associated protein